MVEWPVVGWGERSEPQRAALKYATGASLGFASLAPTYGW